MTIKIEIDGNEVTLTGTTKGDPVDEKARQYSAWRWSGRAGAFVLPRNLNPGTRERNIRSLVASYKAAGVEVEVEDTGVVLSVAEERAQSEQRLTARAERYEDRAERRGAEAERRGAAEHALLDPIPFGQPNINGRLTSVYRHAEGHRIAARAAAQAAEQAASRAEGIRRALEGTPTSTLRRRIEGNEADLRGIERKLNGTGKAMHGEDEPATGAWREGLLTRKARVEEALELDRAELTRRAEEDGVKVWGPEDFVKGDEVAYWGGWATVLRVNKKSLTVPSGYSWTDTVTYDKVRARRRDGEITK